ncbi:MAG: ATP-binding cassette domain-containing protein, partial [Pseudomonadota bacterium]
TIANRVTVLRDGKHVTTKRIEDVSRADLINDIAGRELRAEERLPRAPAGRPILAVENLRQSGVFADISFKVHEGEIVALAGLVGAGRTEIARAIFGADDRDGGTVHYPLSERQVSGPDEAVNAGLAMVPEDRKGKGIIPKMSVTDNIVLSSMPHCVRRGGILDKGRVRAATSRSVAQLDIRPQGSEHRPVETLSGGNQQKVVLARAIESGAALLILDEPTAGVDVGAKAEIHQLILELARQGKGVLLISSEMEEVMALADRILVIREGRLVQELEGHGVSSLALIKSALGETETRAVDAG